MKFIEALKLLCLGTVITVIGICLRGHDILTGVALYALALLVMLKILFALRARRGGGFGPGGGGGDLGGKPVPRPPGGRPPALAAEAEISTERAA
jgi:hypothetical protein